MSIFLRADCGGMWSKGELVWVSLWQTALSSFPSAYPHVPQEIHALSTWSPPLIPSCYDGAHSNKPLLAFDSPMTDEDAGGYKIQNSLSDQDKPLSRF